MLPWLFVVLVLLNAGLFFWGYQREKSLEPPSTPVPEGQYEIRLIGAVPQDFRQAPNVSESAADGDAGSAELPTESPPQGQDGLRADELEAEAPAIPADGGGTRSLAPPVASGPPSEEQVGAMPALPSGDGR